MHDRNNLQCAELTRAPNPPPLRRRIHWAIACASIAVAATLAGIAQSGQEPGGALRIDKASLPTPINQAPDPNAQMQMRGQQGNQQGFAVANAERWKQISIESDQLLTLAIALKAEVDKTNKDTLSLNVIRKADEIEKLAHNVKEKMKLTVGGS